MDFSVSENKTVIPKKKNTLIDTFLKTESWEPRLIECSQTLTLSFIFSSFVSVYKLHFFLTYKQNLICFRKPNLVMLNDEEPKAPFSFFDPKKRCKQD